MGHTQLLGLAFFWHQATNATTCSVLCLGQQLRSHLCEHAVHLTRFFRERPPRFPGLIQHVLTVLQEQHPGLRFRRPARGPRPGKSRKGLPRVLSGVLSEIERTLWSTPESTPISESTPESTLGSTLRVSLIWALCLADGISILGAAPAPASTFVSEPRIAPHGLAFCFMGPWTFAWIRSPQLPHHPYKNGAHSISFCNTREHTPNVLLISRSSSKSLRVGMPADVHFEVLAV